MRRNMTSGKALSRWKVRRLFISSKNYSSWSLRGFLLTRLSGLPFEEQTVSPDDPTRRAELLLQSSSIRMPA